MAEGHGPPRGPANYGGNAPTGAGGSMFEMMVPGNKVGLIIGKSGETIKQLQEHSGAKIVVIQDSAEAANEKPLSITGAPENVEVAKALIIEIINKGAGKGRGTGRGRGGFERGRGGGGAGRGGYGQPQLGGSPNGAPGGNDYGGGEQFTDITSAATSVAQCQMREAFKFREWNTSCKIYIGNLGEKTNKYEIEAIFKQYGRLKNVWVAKNPPGFAFVEYEEAKEAEEAFKMLYGVRASEKPSTNKTWYTKPNQRPGGQTVNIKPPTEDRPGDWLCPKEGCRNVNFSWRENCNKCNSRNPDIRETHEERKQRIYGNNRPERDRGSRGRDYRESHVHHRGQHDFNRGRPLATNREYSQNFRSNYQSRERSYNTDRNYDRNRRD